MSKPPAIGAPFTIDLAVIDDTDSLPAALIKLSEATQEAYDIALDANRTEVATELRKLCDAVAALIAKSLRSDLEVS